MTKPYIPNDLYAQKAKSENYRARSVYKLEELDRKFKLFRPGMHVLDVGAAPGSWMQYASKKVGSNGHILGIDLQAIDPVAENTTTLVCDISNIESVKNAVVSLGWDKVDLILSDIAPATTGISEIDHGRSIDLNTNIFDLSRTILKPGGTLIMKVFEGSSFKDFLQSLNKVYRNVTVTKPRASRDRSFEVYVVCK